MKKLSIQKGILLAIFSSATVVPLSYLESFGEHSILGASIIDIAIGAVFALLVMVPIQKSFKVWRTIVMVLASITTYVWVASLAVNHYHLLLLDLSYDTGMIFSGAIGALITGLVIHFLAPLSLSKRSYLLLLMLGSISGYLFSFTIDSNNIFINAVGFMVWQVSVAFSIYSTKR